MITKTSSSPSWNNQLYFQIIASNFPYVGIHQTMSENYCHFDYRHCFDWRNDRFDRDHLDLNKSDQRNSKLSERSYLDCYMNLLVCILHHYFHLFVDHSENNHYLRKQKQFSFNFKLRIFLLNERFCSNDDEGWFSSVLWIGPDCCRPNVGWLVLGFGLFHMGLASFVCGGGFRFAPEEKREICSLDEDGCWVDVGPKRLTGGRVDAVRIFCGAGRTSFGRWVLKSWLWFEWCRAELLNTCDLKCNWKGCSCF